MRDFFNQEEGKRNQIYLQNIFLFRTKIEIKYLGAIPTGIVDEKHRTNGLTKLADFQMVLL